MTAPAAPPASVPVQTSATAFAAALARHPSPIVFSIAGKSLKLDTASDVAPYVAQLTALDGVTHVDFSGNTFGVAACQALAECLATKQTLVAANLSDMFTGRLKSEIPDCLRALTGAVKSFKGFELLDLSDNAFGPAGADPLVPFLSTTTSLRELRLNNNGLGIAGGTTVAQTLAANTRTPLAVLVAGRNRLENGSSPYWAKAFTAHRATLEHVQMPQNGIRPEGVVELMGALAQCTNLRVLDLQDNTFTYVGSRALARAMPALRNSLREINVGDCLLGARGARRVFKSLRASKVAGVEVALFGFNEMDASGAKAAAAWVRDVAGRNLTWIDVNGNSFDAEGDEADEIKSAVEKWGKDVEAVMADMDEMEEPDSDEEDKSEAEAEAGESSDEEVEPVEAANGKAAKAQQDKRDDDELAAQFEKVGI